MITERRVATATANRVGQVHMVRVNPIRKSAIRIFHVSILVKCAQILTLVIRKSIARVLNKIVEACQRLLAHF